MSSERGMFEIRFGMYNYQLSSSDDDLHRYGLVPVAFLLYYPPLSSFQRLATEAAADEEACCVCFVNRPNAKFTRCGHSSICCVCAYRLVRSDAPKCPLCRARIVGVDLIPLGTTE